MGEVRKLLASGQRARHAAEVRLQPYLVIEENLRDLHGVTTRRVSTSRLVESLKAGQWTRVLPLMAGIVTNPEARLPVLQRVSKTEAFPVKVDAPAPTAVVFKYGKVEDRYPFLTMDLADKLNLTTNRVVGLVKLSQLTSSAEIG